MTWEEKMAALQCLCPDAHLRMREPGDWYVRMPGVEAKYGDILSSVGESGETPEEAVGNTFCVLADGKLLIKDAKRETRKAYRWKGFMWGEVTEPEVKYA